MNTITPIFIPVDYSSSGSINPLTALIVLMAFHVFALVLIIVGLIIQREIDLDPFMNDSIFACTGLMFLYVFLFVDLFILILWGLYAILT